jgi:adenosylhomocysteine nucleosidase
MPPRSRHCTVAIVFALPIEADVFQRRATEVIDFKAAGLTLQEGSVARHRVAWSICGPGHSAAAHATQLLIDGHRPRLMISAGFAGGLAPGLPRGKLVTAHDVVRWKETITGSLPLETGPTANLCGDEPLRLVTVDEILARTADKLALAAATGGQLVDMETYAVAESSAKNGLPCCSIRVISDAATDDLPEDLGRLMQPQTAMRRLGSALGLMGRRPTMAVDLWKLWERGVVDARTLADGICSLIAPLPPREHD